jgi:uncharacterized protein YcaQ
MDKTLTISGKRVVFRKTGGTVLRYKRAFGREFNDDLQKIASLYRFTEKDTETMTEAEKAELVNAALGVETEWMYDMAFIMAQQADPSITDELDWLDGFDDFNPLEVFSELMELIYDEQKVSAKNV